MRLHCKGIGVGGGRSLLYVLNFSVTSQKVSPSPGGLIPGLMVYLHDCVIVPNTAPITSN
jgi:hypothetical protein